MKTKQKAYVYILKCRDGSYYTGSTTNLEMRVWEHKMVKEQTIQEKDFQ